MYTVWLVDWWIRRRDKTEHLNFTDTSRGIPSTRGTLHPQGELIIEGAATHYATGCESCFAN
jgi:hypothetical protein